MTIVNIIGGSGFIGTRLSALFARDKLKFKIIDKVISSAFPAHTVLADVRAVEMLEGAISENAILINLAAEHSDNARPRSLYDEVNVQGARNLCAVASLKGTKKIIFTSSVAVYGFAPFGTNETGAISPFNDYGRTKYEAELIFKKWQQEDPLVRTLVIVRPTVVFGEQNRGNVYNLLRQIVSGRFIMIGKGENRKSMAYVENIAAFLRFSIAAQPGLHIYNYIDKPDFTMNEFVRTVRRVLGRTEYVGFALPYTVGYLIGKGFDFFAAITGRSLSISSIRVKKFCANSVYDTQIEQTGFVAPVPLSYALERTIQHEFLDSHEGEPVFYSE